MSDTHIRVIEERSEQLFVVAQRAPDPIGNGQDCIKAELMGLIYSACEIVSAIFNRKTRAFALRVDLNRPALRTTAMTCSIDRDSAKKKCDEICFGLPKNLAVSMFVVNGKPAW